MAKLPGRLYSSKCESFGEKGNLNRYVPIFRRYAVPVRYNFRKEDMTWIPYKPQAKMLALDHIYPEGIHIPDYFIDKNIIHLPTVKTHMYTTTPAR